MEIIRYLSGVQWSWVGPAGIILAGPVDFPTARRIVGSQGDLQAALHSPRGRAALIEALGGEDRSWDPGPLVSPQAVGELGGSFVPWALVHPDTGRSLAHIPWKEGTGGGPGPEMEGTPRHALNMLLIRSRRVLHGEEVLFRITRNLLDDLGRRLA